MQADDGGKMTTVERTGPMPTGRKWKDMPVPFFFNEEAAEAFSRRSRRVLTM